MHFQTIICGLALVILGIYGYIQGKERIDAENAAAVAAFEKAKETDPNAPVPKPKSVVTALIPAFFGGALILCGLIVAVAPKTRKHVMHLAAMVGVLGAAGGLVPILRSGEFDLAKPAVRTGLLMTFVCVFFVVLCVKSFIDARKARQAVAS
jgi:hypothetical protein